MFTPLLASTAVGTLESRSVTEPIRQLRSVEYLQASVERVCFKERTITAAQSNIPFDRLVIACGAVANTFGIRGVKEHAQFLRSMDDAARIRQMVLSRLEEAMRTPKAAPILVHFVIVGAGATGCEFAAELHDFVAEDLARLYPAWLIKAVRISLLEVAERVLGAFDERLAKYAMDLFQRDGIQMEMGVQVKLIAAHRDTVTNCLQVELKDGRVLEVGMVVWTAGITGNPLISTLDLPKESSRLLVDEQLRCMDNVWAAGDCARIRCLPPLPATAQVAYQQAKYLAQQLQKPTNLPFVYQPRGMLAYVGGWRAILDTSASTSSKWWHSGRITWLVWRSAYFVMTVSWRNKLLIPMYWFLTWAFGRDITNNQEGIN